MDIEKAKEAYKGLKKNAFIVESIDKDFFLDFAETILNELDKKDKIINEMANEIYITAIRDDGTHFSTSQEVIDYFTKKVTKED